MIRVLTIAWVGLLEIIRRKDLYVLLILLVALLFVLMSVNVFGLGAMVRYVADIGLLFAWVFSIVLAVSMSGRQLPQEEARGTIYPLLAKPVTRAQLITGKWLGTWMASAVATGVFYLLIFALLKLRGGVFSEFCAVQAILLHVVFLGCVTALTLACSTRMSYGAAASVSYLGIAASFFVAPEVPGMVMHAQGVSATALMALFYGLPHFNLFDLRQRLVHDWGPAPWPTVGMIVLYGALWTALLLGLAWLGYRRKRFRRGTLG